MPKKRSIILGKLARRAARLRGGGSAFPGLVIEKTDKTFVYDCLSQILRGIVVISGTNGKTTTTKIAVELLESQGLKVFTNCTGSNLLRGIIAALIEQIGFDGKLHADIAVLELDEAHATHLVNIISPKYSVLLNVFSDQTERFTSVDQTAEYLARIAQKTTDTMITNRDDFRLSKIEVDSNIVYFGASSELAEQFQYAEKSAQSNSSDEDLTKAADITRKEAFVTLEEYSPNKTTYLIGENAYTAKLSLSGIYNSLNAAAALTLVKTILPDSDTQNLISTLSLVQPAFGRGEIFEINGSKIEMLLVKNTSGFGLILNSFDPEGYEHMIVTNNAVADGIDISWYRDVDFSKLKKSGVSILSGTCAAEVSGYLKEQAIPHSHIDEDIISAITRFLANSNNPKRIYCSYTAMLTVRKHLAKLAK